MRLHITDFQIQKKNNYVLRDSSITLGKGILLVTSSLTVKVIFSEGEISAEQQCFNEEEVNYVTNRKFVICESQLNKLLNRIECKFCRKNLISASKILRGTKVNINMGCSNDHEVLDWSSQYHVRKSSSFNLLLCSSIIFSGNGFFL